jgi:hypothetical protein
LIPFKVNLGETKEISYFTAYVYNTLWSGIRNSRSGPIARHYKVLWLTTLIRQYLNLQPGPAREEFIRQVRIKNSRKSGKSQDDNPGPSNPGPSNPGPSNPGPSNTGPYIAYSLTRRRP